MRVSTIWLIKSRDRQIVIASEAKQSSYLDDPKVSWIASSLGSSQ
jgi:hypothetical protein